MSKPTESIKGILEFVSNNGSALATIFVLVGLLFLSIGFLRYDASGITTRDNTLFAPLISGAILAGIGLLLFVRESNKRDANLRESQKHDKTIVFYSPTIRANSFFVELLDHSIDLCKQKGYKFEMEKGNLAQYHDADNYLDVIRKYSKSNASNTVLIMIPPSPSAYEHIWRLPKELEANLITLDMDIEGSHKQFEECQFHRKIITVNNEKGAMLAAQEIVSFCKEEHIGEINVVICEGHFHARGELFKAKIDRLARDSDLKVHHLGQFEKLSFSDAVRKARNYIGYYLRRSKADLKKRDTFIFCANDNLAIGARMEISHIVSGTEEEYKPIRILCFDASTFVKIHIDQNDKFFWCAIDQRYTEIVREAFDSAEVLLEGQSLKKEIYAIEPVIYKRYKRLEGETNS